MTVPLQVIFFGSWAGASFANATKECGFTATEVWGQVGVEVKIRRPVQIDALRNQVPDITFCILNGFERGFLLFGAALDRQPDVCLLQIGRNEDFSNGHGPDAGVSQFVIEDFFEFVAEGFGNTLITAGIHDV